ALVRGGGDRAGHRRWFVVEIVHACGLAAPHPAVLLELADREVNLFPGPSRDPEGRANRPELGMQTELASPRCTRSAGHSLPFLSLHASGDDGLNAGTGKRAGFDRSSVAAVI